MTLLGASAVLVVAALGFSVAGRSSRRRLTTGARAALAGPGVAASGPSSPDSKPVAAGRDVAGSIRAATAIVAMEPALVATDDAGAARLVSSWSADSAAAALVEMVDRQRASFAHAPGGPYSFQVAPLAAKASPAGPDAVNVQLWCAEVVFAKAKPSYASFVTESLHLLWQGGRWRLTDSTDTAGPVVPLGPTVTAGSIEETMSRLAGFGPVGLLENGR